MKSEPVSERKGKRERREAQREGTRESESYWLLVSCKRQKHELYFDKVILVRERDLERLGLPGHQLYAIDHTGAGCELERDGPELVAGIIGRGAWRERKGWKERESEARARREEARERMKREIRRKARGERAREREIYQRQNTQ